MEFKNINYQIEDGYALLTINRPDKLNALNLATFAELAQALLMIHKDESVSGVLLTGAGEKAFVAGADITEIQHLNLAEGKEFSAIGQRVFDTIEDFSKPVLALIDGFALGGGCELAMACHLRLATEKSRFGQPEVNLGLIPGYAGTQRLPRLIGRSAALELLLSGEMIDARRAYDLGLVNRVVHDKTELLESGKQMLRTITSKSPLSIKYILNLVNQGLNMPLNQAEELESTYFGMMCSSYDKQEGTAAFLEKRKPVFNGK